MKRRLSRLLSIKMLVAYGVLSLVLVLWFRIQMAPEDSSSPKMADLLSTSKKSVFEPVLPDRPVSFPDAFSFHNDFQQEWWLYFANLTDANGQSYSVQWSYRRIAREDTSGEGWNNSQLYLVQTVISSLNKVWRHQRLARGGIGQAGMSRTPFNLWIDNWNWRSLGYNPLPGMLTVSTDEFSLKLSSSTTIPFQRIGDRGYRLHHDLLPQASYGVQAPFIRSSGTLTLDGQEIDVSGQAWMSKEWGSDLENNEGQKRLILNLHLSNGDRLQINQNRLPHYLPYHFGVLIKADGSKLPLSDNEISISAVEYRRVAERQPIPLKWIVKVPKLDIALSVKPIHDDLWHPFIVPYWQGPVSANGTQNAQGMLYLGGY